MIAKFRCFSCYHNWRFCPVTGPTSCFDGNCLRIDFDIHHLDRHCRLSLIKFILSLSISNWSNFDDMILEVVIDLVDVQQRSPDPMYDLFWGGNPLQNFFFFLHFSCWNYKKISMTDLHSVSIMHPDFRDMIDLVPALLKVDFSVYVIHCWTTMLLRPRSTLIESDSWQHALCTTTLILVW